MEQAKWYYICFIYDLDLKNLFHYRCLLTHLKMDGLNRTNHFTTKGNVTENETKPFYDVWIWFLAKTFCGKKKLNKLIEEAHLLGLEDELLIFERRN